MVHEWEVSNPNLGLTILHVKFVCFRKVLTAHVINFDVVFVILFEIVHYIFLVVTEKRVDSLARMAHSNNSRCDIAQV